LRGRHDPEAGAAMTLARRTVNVLHRLQLSGIGERPVLFITHSLGGLLVKSVLREAATTPGRAEMQRLAEQCRGVMFLATPHQGSLLANFAKAIRVYLPSVSTRDLRSNSEQLLELQRWYRGYAASQRIHTRSYYENQPTSVVTVVSAWSSDPGVSGPTARDPIPLDRNHLEISQPLDRNDEVVLGAAELIREVLQEAPIASSDATQAAATEAMVLVRSFQAAWQRDPADAAVAVDLSDLFNGRQPIHAGVWAVDIPQRIAAVMPAIARLPLPCVLALEAHLAICWYLGTQLHLKTGLPVKVRQRGAAGESIWDLSTARLPEGSADWQLSERELGRGNELALVLSVTHNADADSQRAIEALELPVGLVVHASLPIPGEAAVTDGPHARWLAESLVRHFCERVVVHLPPKLHLFAACPAGLMLLRGQGAQALCPATTVYEFGFDDAGRGYWPGMGVGLGEG
ncbi:MAG: SAVED domain-containing protein, partial [Sphaerospermopsis kisseleviana]